MRPVGYRRHSLCGEKTNMPGETVVIFERGKKRVCTKNQEPAGTAFLFPSSLQSAGCTIHMLRRDAKEGSSEWVIWSVGYRQECAARKFAD